MKFNKIRTVLLSITFSILSTQVAHAATYTVVKGDTLYSLGRLFGTSYTTIASNSNISGSTIYPGQKLTVPGTYHTVKSGETLYSISRKYGVNIDAIRKASAEWDDIIYPGQQLLMPNGSTSSTPKTEAPTTTTKPAVISYTASKLDLLARLVRAEAENQSYKAKVAVAAVVINRVQSPLFANTINGVIYEKSGGYYQFTPVVNGHINKTASSTDLQAAKEALQGSDPTNGALFYFDESTTNQWLRSKKVALIDGNMIFSY